MNFVNTELSVLAYANNFTMWHYNHEGSHEDISKDNFFLKANDMLRKGDLIIINCKDANTSAWVTTVSPDNVSIVENIIPTTLGK